MKYGRSAMNENPQSLTPATHSSFIPHPSSFPLTPSPRHPNPQSLFPNTQPPATFLRLSARPLTCLEAWTYGWYNVSQSAPPTSAMSNKPIRFSSQPLIPQRLAPQVAMRATSPFSSPPANLHLRQPPHLDAPRNALLYHNLRRLTLTPARRNHYLRPAQRPLCNSHLHTRN